MKRYKVFFRVVFHIVFWVCFFIYFTVNNNLRPFPSLHPYKEYLIGLGVLISSYLVYFFLTPRYYLAGYFKYFYIGVVLLLFSLTLFEFSLLHDDLLLWRQAFPEDYRLGLMLQIIILVLLRNACFIGLFFLLRTNRYYLKNIQAERMGLLQNTSYYNIVLSMKEVKTVKITDIMYIRHQKNYSYFYMSDGVHYAQYMSLTKVMGELPKTLFMRISRNTIVNTRYIVNYKKGILSLQSLRVEGIEETNLPVSQTYKKEVKEYLSLQRG